MGHCVRLIVPTDKEAELGPIIGRVLERWGGVTILDASGWWEDDDGNPVKDTLSVLECSVGLWDIETRAWWHDLSAAVCDTFGQDCVFLSVQHETAILVRKDGMSRHLGGGNW